MSDSAMATKVCVALFAARSLLHMGPAFTVAEVRSRWRKRWVVELARAVGTRIRDGQAYLNGDMDLLDMTAPFGGCKMLGNEREWGTGGFGACLEEISFIGYSPALRRGSPVFMSASV